MAHDGDIIVTQHVNKRSVPAFQNYIYIACVSREITDLVKYVFVCALFAFDGKLHHAGEDRLCCAKRHVNRAFFFGLFKNYIHFNRLEKNMVLICWALFFYYLFTPTCVPQVFDAAVNVRKRGGDWSPYFSTWYNNNNDFIVFLTACMGPLSC